MSKTPHPLSKTIVKEIKSGKKVNPPKGYTKFDVLQSLFADAILRDALHRHEGDLAYHENLVPNVAAHLSDYMTQHHMYAPRNAYVVSYFIGKQGASDNVVFTFLARGDEAAATKKAERMRKHVFEQVVQPNENYGLESEDALKISVTDLGAYLGRLLQADKALEA